jgi:hypothetical protein
MVHRFVVIEELWIGGNIYPVDYCKQEKFYSIALTKS